ncbi:DUF5829 family protein [Chitinimonas viridis]|uniref:DUF5829 family protein n=1 Tax=Chitinimonas viridis TaxID=664880 RepID=A0ABT8B3F7_9NEIS|nr:DUF5829 family protein [Chitinimonas viridis]MDN3576073.1 DUF5829 family protein [Chitinimonas viridis]
MQPLVTLNHLYLYLDQATRDAILASPFMRQEFAALTVSTAAMDDGRQWTGVYLTGEQTYIELFCPADEGQEAVGDAGIALATETEGDIELAKQVLAKAGLDYPIELLQRELEGVKVPWFWNLSLIAAAEREPEPFCAWIMEVERDYLARSGLPAADAPTGISRREYNAQRFDPGRYLKDVTEITLALPADQAALFGQQLCLLGYAATAAEQGMAYQGPGMVLSVQLATGQRRGVIAIRLSLQREKQGETEYRFGSGSVLQFDRPDSAIWRFTG